MVWEKNKTRGEFSTNISYKVTYESINLEMRWWWKHVWKMKVAKISRFFFWMALKTKVLTWDLLQLRNN